jgi:methanogenic corrinoid protein MtbC1
MGSTEQFVAQILETSAVGYAGLTAGLLLERHPEIARRYEPDGFSNWKPKHQPWLIAPSAAVDAGEPRLFEARMLWTKKAFMARQASVEDLHAALTALRDTLRERLPADTADTVVSAIDRALEAVADPRAGEAGDLDADEPAGRSALSYLETILGGKPREAIEQVLTAVDGGTSVKDAYLEVLIPAQREAGRLWHADELSIAEEHVVTSTTQRAMALLCERGRSSSRKDKTALLACVAGNVHDIGVRAISDFFEMAGWQAINLGADVPDDEIARSVTFFDADVVLLAAALDPHLKAVQRAIERIRTFEDLDVKIIVGGPAFDRVPDLWRKIGADGYAAKVEDAEPLGSRLTRS